MSAASLFPDSEVLLRFDRACLFLLPATIVKSRQPCAEQRDGRWFRHRGASGKAEGDAIVPEVTIGIETERNVASVQKIGAQEGLLKRAELEKYLV